MAIYNGSKNKYLLNNLQNTDFGGIFDFWKKGKDFLIVINTNDNNDSKKNKKNILAVF